jgi:hypothetical protein
VGGEMMPWKIDPLLFNAICWGAFIAFLAWAVVYSNKSHMKGTYLFVTIKLYALETAITAVFLVWLYSECAHQIQQLLLR